MYKYANDEKTLAFYVEDGWTSTIYLPGNIEFNPDSQLYINFLNWISEGNEPLPLRTPEENFNWNTIFKIQMVANVSDEISMLTDFVSMGQDIAGEADRLLALRNWRLAVYRTDCHGAWPFKPTYPPLPADIPGTNSVTSRNLKAMV